MYGSETWTLKKDAVKKIEAFEMWTLRRMMRIKWHEKVTLAEVLKRENSSRELVQTIQIRKMKYCGHLMRGKEKYEIPRLVLEGRRGWLDDIKEWTDIGTEEILSKSKDRKLWCLMVANLLNGEGTIG